MAGGALTAARWSLTIVGIENTSRVTRMHPGEVCPVLLVY